MLTVSDNHIVLGGGGGGGDVVGAASSTDNAIARFDGTTGKIIQNSNVIVSDTGALGVGIAPTDILHVSYSSTGAKGFTLQNTNGAAGGLATFWLMTDLGASRRSAVLKNSSNATMYGGANSLIFYQYSSDPIAFVVNNRAVPNMYISANNNVGVNTVDATAQLDVNGTFRSRGNATFNGQIIDNSGSAGTDGQVLKKVGGLVVWANP